MAQDAAGSSPASPGEPGVDEEFRFLLCENCRQEAECPKLLPCLHNVCLQCLQETKPVNCCPVCQAPHSQTEGASVQDNLLFANLRAKLSTYQRIKSGRDLVCDNCKKEGTYWCSECREFLCTPCFESHQRYLKRENHEARAVKDIKTESSKDFLTDFKNVSVMFCSNAEHKTQNLSIYCRACQRSLCCICAVLDCQHNGQHCHIREEIQRRQQELLGMSTELAEKKTSYDRTCGNLRDQVQNIVQVKNRTRELIQQKVEEIVRRVQEKGEQLLTLVQEQHQRQVRDTEEKLHHMELVVQRMESCKQLVEKMQLYASDQEVIDMYPFIRESLEELKRKQPPAVETKIRVEGFEEVEAQLQAFYERVTDEREAAPAPAVRTVSNQTPGGKSPVKRKSVQVGTTSQNPPKLIKMESEDVEWRRSAGQVDNEQPGTSSAGPPQGNGGSVWKGDDSLVISEERSPISISGSSNTATLWAEKQAQRQQQHHDSTGPQGDFSPPPLMASAEEGDGVRSEREPEAPPTANPGSDAKEFKTSYMAAIAKAQKEKKRAEPQECANTRDNAFLPQASAAAILKPPKPGRAYILQETGRGPVDPVTVSQGSDTRAQPSRKSEPSTCNHGGTSGRLLARNTTPPAAQPFSEEFCSIVRQMVRDALADLPFPLTHSQGPSAEAPRFFKPDDYEYLLDKTMLALDLRDPPCTEGAGSSSHKTGGGPKGNTAFSPRANAAEKVFPFPAFLERHLKGEWAEPMARKRSPTLVNDLYALPASTNRLLQVPLVDGPVAALQPPGLPSQAGESPIRDRLDRKADSALRKAHEATAMSIRASATAAVVSRAAAVWSRELVRLVPASSPQLVEGANGMLTASSFIADATLDSVVFASRAMAASAAARRMLWLRAWQADVRSKLIVAAYPFQGDRLFGESLDRILVDTKGKKKAMPKSVQGAAKGPWGNLSFYSRQDLSKCHGDDRRQGGGSSGQTFRRESFAKQSGGRPEWPNRKEKPQGP